MFRRMHIVCTIAATLLIGCSKAPEPGGDVATPSTTVALPEASDAVLRASLTIGGIDTEYAATFEAGQLARIIEHRHIERETFGGEYELTGARLLRYRGAKLRDAAPLDLVFDMQGALLSDRGPDASDEAIREIRNRAQLLRNHALAQHATKIHH